MPGAHEQDVDRPISGHLVGDVGAIGGRAYLVSRCHTALSVPWPRLVGLESAPDGRLLLTDEQQDVQRTARAGEREILPRIRELDSTSTYDRTLYEKMGSVGFTGLPIPERYGGSGMDYIAFAGLCEEMERADTAFRVILSVHTGLNSLTLLQWATEEQKQQYLVPEARGEKLAPSG